MKHNITPTFRRSEEKDAVVVHCLGVWIVRPSVRPVVDGRVIAVIAAPPACYCCCGGGGVGNE